MKSFSRPFILELEDILPRVMANRTSLTRSEIKEEIDFIRSEIGYEEFYEDIRQNDGGRYMRISRIGQMFPLKRPERQEVIRAFSRAFEVVFENFEVRNTEGRSSDTIYESYGDTFNDLLPPYYEDVNQRLTTGPFQYFELVDVDELRTAGHALFYEEDNVGRITFAQPHLQILANTKQIKAVQITEDNFLRVVVRR